MEPIESSQLHMGALIGDIEMVREALDGGVDVNSLTSRSGRSAVHLALVGVEEGWVAEKRLGMLRELLNRGGDVNMKDAGGRTPLMYCIRSGRDGSDALARVLLEQGADPLVEDKDAHTAFHQASDLRRQDILSILVEYGPPVQNFPLGRDRRTLLHLLASCSKNQFRKHLDLTPAEFINSTCQGYAPDGVLSLPCCLIQNRDIDGLTALFNKEGISPVVLMSPVVSELCRGIYSPITFALVKDMFSELPFQVMQLFLDHCLPLDPDYPGEAHSGSDTEVLTCLDVLADVHEFHLGNNLAGCCHCTRLFPLLLESGARLVSRSRSLNIVSPRLLKFLYVHNSLFGLAHLLMSSNFLEPVTLLDCLMSLISSDVRLSVMKNKRKVVGFLAGLCSPGDVVAVRSKLSQAPHHVLSSLSHLSCGVPSLKSLSRCAARRQCRLETSHLPSIPLHYFSSLPLPKSLVSYLRYSDLVSSLETHPLHQPFIMSSKPQT